MNEAIGVWNSRKICLIDPAMFDRQRLGSVRPVLTGVKPTASSK